VRGACCRVALHSRTRGALGTIANIPNLEKLAMNPWIKSGAITALLSAFLLIGLPDVSFADVKDYEFQLVQNEMKKGDGAIVAVRLVNKKSGKVVPDAVIFAKRIDMSPDAMQEMAAPLEQLASTEAGIYRFKTNLMMEGRWRLSLGAKVQGEEGTVASQLIIKAVP
jgi:anti-sigma factor RsiW